jgi:hypothetical protein
MAYCVNDPKVGQYVYKHCKPQNPGVIVSVDGKDFGGYFMCVHVQWLKAKPGSEVTGETTAGLKDFEALIKDHRKKLNTHEANHQRLTNLEVKQCLNSLKIKEL